MKPRIYSVEVIRNDVLSWKKENLTAAEAQGYYDACGAFFDILTTKEKQGLFFRMRAN